MELKDLETFVYTVKYKSFFVAARKIYLSQSTISQHISCLERELETELISRTTREFTVTEDGKKLYRYATRLLELMDMAMSDITGQDDEYLNFGASFSITGCILPELMAAFKRDNPQSKFLVDTQCSRDIIKK